MALSDTYKPSDKVQVERLRKAMQASWDAGDDDRARFTRIVKKMSDTEGGVRGRIGKNTPLRPIMGLRKSLNTLMAELTGGEVQFSCTTQYGGSARGFARTQQAALNLLACEIKLSQTLAKGVMGAFVKLGITKPHYRQDAALLFGVDERVRPSKPFMSNVSFTKYGFDRTADDEHAVQFEFDFYDVDWEALNEIPGVDKKALAMLKRDKQHAYDSEAKEQQDARTAFGFLPEPGRLAFDRYRVVDVYLPSLKEVHTYPFRVEGKPLLVRPMTDPEGFYRKFSLGDIPDNVLSCSQAESLEALDDMTNSSMRKIALCIRAMKTVGIFSGGGDEDAEVVNKALHGKVVGIKGDIDGYQNMEVGGVGKNLPQALALTSKLYDDADNGLNLRAGIGGNSPTATEASIVSASASRLTNWYQQRTLAYYSSCGEALRRMMYDDEYYERDVTYEHPKLPGVEIEDRWTSSRIGKVEDYTSRVIAHTIVHEPPAARMQRNLAMAERIGGLAAVPGVNIEEVISTVADSGYPDLRRWFNAPPPTEEETGASSERQLQKPHTVREQIRRSEAQPGNELAQIAAGME